MSCCFCCCKPKGSPSFSPEETTTDLSVSHSLSPRQICRDGTAVTLASMTDRLATPPSSSQVSIVPTVNHLQTVEPITYPVDRPLTPPRKGSTEKTVTASRRTLGPPPSPGLRPSPHYGPVNSPGWKIAQQIAAEKRQRASAVEPVQEDSDSDEETGPVRFCTFRKDSPPLGAVKKNQ